MSGVFALYLVPTVLAASTEDQLAGVRTNKPIDKSAFQCEGVTCRRQATVGLLAGVVDVVLCGDVVRTVAFSQTFLDEKSWGGATTKKVSLPIGFSLADDAGVSASKFYTVLADGLSATGWKVDQELSSAISTKMLLDGGSSSIKCEYFIKNGQLRLLCIEGRLQQGAYTTTLSTVTEDPCLSGL
jgi:hypothetical protein